MRHHVNGFDMTEVFSDQDHNYRHDQDHGFRLENRSGEIGNSDPAGINQRLEVNRLAQSHHIGEQPVKNIGNHNAHENQQLLQESSKVNRDKTHDQDRCSRIPLLKVGGTHAFNGNRS